MTLWELEGQFQKSFSRSHFIQNVLWKCPVCSSCQRGIRFPSFALLRTLCDVNKGHASSQLEQLVLALSKTVSVASTVLPEAVNRGLFLLQYSKWSKYARCQAVWQPPGMKSGRPENPGNAPVLDCHRVLLFNNEATSNHDWNHRLPAGLWHFFVFEKCNLRQWLGRVQSFKTSLKHLTLFFLSLSPNTPVNAR